MKSKKVDKAREKSEDICRLYLGSNKNGCVILSEIYDVSPGTILNILKENGIKIRDNEVVHHINGDKLDNRIENLQLLTRREHSRLHYNNSKLNK